MQRLVMALLKQAFISNLPRERYAGQPQEIQDSEWVSYVTGEKAILLVFCLHDMAQLQAGEKGGIEHMGVPDINTEHALI